MRGDPSTSVQTCAASPWHCRGSPQALGCAFWAVLEDACLASKSRECKTRSFYFYVLRASFLLFRKEGIIQKSQKASEILFLEGELKWMSRPHFLRLFSTAHRAMPIFCMNDGVRPCSRRFSISVLDLLCQNVSIQKYVCIFPHRTILASVQFIFNQRPFLWKAQ